MWLVDQVTSGVVIAFQNVSNCGFRKTILLGQCLLATAAYSIEVDGYDAALDFRIHFLIISFLDHSQLTW